MRIDEVEVTKSARQLGYVWGAAYPCIKKYIHDTTDNKFDIGSIIHPYNVEAHNKDNAISISKTIDLGLGDFTIRRSMSGWGVRSMNAYIDWLLMTYADRFGLYIPEPDKWWRERGRG